MNFQNPHEPVPCIVFDLFMGSGTVAEVAVKLGRDYVGTELSPEYTAMARKRLEAVDTGVPVKEADKGQMALFGGAEK
jgi:site-specific DNA-methyltransferase (adenine-specific)